MYYGLRKIIAMSKKNRVYIFDTTMRDGELSPGASMSLEDIKQISRERSVGGEVLEVSSNKGVKIDD